MITIHKRIDNLTDNQVILLIKTFGEYAKGIDVKFQHLPRFSINLSGMQLNPDILKMILHAAAASETLLQVEISRFFFVNKSLIQQMDTIDKEVISRIDWVEYANRILLIINDCLTIMHENGVWDVHPIPRLLQIREIRELSAVIRQKESNRFNNKAYIGNKFYNTNGSIHLGDVNNIIQNPEEVPKNNSTSDFDKIKRLVAKGNTKDALILLDSVAETYDDNIKNSIVMLSGKYNSLRVSKIREVLSHDEFEIGISKINEGILNVIGLIKIE